MALDPDDIEGISFGTDGWRARGDAFSVPRIRAVGQATVTHLDAEGIDGPLAIGYDARSNSERAMKELARVAAANGRDVTIPRRDCPTPALAWTVKTGSYAAGLMVTASHNPPEYNGIKLVGSDGAPAMPATTDGVASHLAAPDPLAESEYGSIEREPLRDAYLAHLESFVDVDLDGVSVAVDAMHGSARGVTDTLLEELGATVTRIRTERDPEFGGDSPEPSPDRVPELLETVSGAEADIGFVNDGDGDRLGVVTPGHGYLDPNVVLAVLYEYVLDSDAGDAARTVSTSSLVDQIAESWGFSTQETPVGFKWIADTMAESDVIAGGEESGGYGVSAHLRNKDGIAVAGLLAAAHSEQPLDDRIERIRSTYGSRIQNRRSVSCPEDQKSGALERSADTLDEEIAGTAIERVSAVDGRKFHLADGSWVLIRPSGTEPKMRVYAESSTPERTQTLLDAGERAVRTTLE